MNLSNLNQDIAELAFDSTTNSLTVGISDGASQTISLATLGSTTVSGSLTIKSGTSSYTLPTAIGGVGQVLAIENASSGTTTWTTLTAGGTSTAITGLVSVTEGGNVGHRIATREANNHGDIGMNAVDLSFSNIAGSTSHGATGFGSFAAGNETSASGLRATALGHRTLASGNHSVAIGYTAQASEEYAVALGRGQAQGEDAFAVGPQVYAYSFAEVALGAYPSIYTATSRSVWIPTDRLLVLGNGSGTASRSNALVILKDGTTTLNGALTINTTSTTASYTLPVGGGANGQVLSMLDASSGTTTWTSVSGSGVFTSNANTLFSSIGTTTHDFIIGSEQIDNITGADDDARMYFDKSKAAFRAGHASGTSWNEAMVGDRSAAFGFNTEASGDRSTAFGNATQASSYAEIALGSYNTTVTPNSTASWNTNDRLLVVGNGNSSANRSNALEILKDGTTTLNGVLTINTSSTTASYTLPVGGGSNGQVLSMLDATTGTTTWTTTARGELQRVTESGNTGYRLAIELAANHGDIGDEAIDLSIKIAASASTGARGNYSFAAGRNTTASGIHSFAFVDGTQAIANHSTAWGRDTSASNFDATAWGRDTNATGQRSTAWGDNTTAAALLATAWGDSTAATANYTTAWGRSSIASASYSTAFGEEITAESYGQTSLGLYNTPHPGTPNATASVAGDRLLVVGNGTSAATRSDALVILKNGNTTLNGELTLDPTGTSSYTLPTARGTAGQVLSIDNANSGTTTWTNVVTEITGLVSVTENRNTGYRLANADTANHGDIGDNAIDLSIQDQASIVRGASGDFAFAVGNRTVASGDYSTVFGFDSTASGKYSSAFGQETRAEAYAQTTLGHNSTLHPGTPNATGITATDRLLVVGNGTTASTRSDALVILKNGHVGIGDSTPTEGTLVVSGTIVSSGNMTTNATLTPDYVFESYF